MAKVCPKCEREFANSSVKCPICNCGLLKKEDFLKGDYEVAESQNIKEGKTEKATGVKTKQVKTNIPKNNKKTNGMMIIALCVICLFIVSKKAGTGDSKKENITSNDTEADFVTKEQGDLLDSAVNNEILDKETLLYNAVESAVGKDELLDFVYVSETSYLAITFLASDSLTSNMIVTGAYLDIREILKSIQPMVDADVYICVKYPMIDTYGNPHEQKVIQADYTLDTIQKINFDYFISDNVPTIADSWWNHPSFVIEK